MTAPRLLIIGPQGSGKGTQGERIAAAFRIPAVSTGDVFRANVKDGTELGLQVKAIIDAGDLVPDELTGAIVRDRLAQDDAADGFLLDGYPRNLAQVGDLDAFLDGRGEPLTAVIELSVPRDESIRRIALRAVEQGRADDNEESIAKRLSIYESRPRRSSTCTATVASSTPSTGWDRSTRSSSAWSRLSPRAASSPDRGSAPLPLQDARSAAGDGRA